MLGRGALHPNPKLVDPSLAHLGDLHLPALELERLADLRNAPQPLEQVPADGGLVVIVDLEVQLLGKRAQVGLPVHHPRPVLAAHEGIVVGVELVLDLADDLLEDVLDGHQAGGGAVLVDDDGHVHAPPAHVAQQLVDQRGLAYLHHRAAHVAQRGVAPLDVGLQEVLGVHDADGGVKAAVGTAEGEPGVSGLHDQPPGLGEVLIGRKVHDLGPGLHDLAGAAVAVEQGGLCHALLLDLDEPLLRALAQQGPQLVLAVGLAACLAGRRHAEGLEQQVAHPVEEVHHGLGGQVEGPHQRG